MYDCRYEGVDVFQKKYLSSIGIDEISVRDMQTKYSHVRLFLNIIFHVSRPDAARR